MEEELLEAEEELLEAEEEGRPSRFILDPALGRLNRSETWGFASSSSLVFITLSSADKSISAGETKTILARYIFFLNSA